MGVTNALLKFTQGSTIGGDGEALKGDLSDPFGIANSDNTGVASWEIQVLAVPFGSSVPVGVLAQANSSNPVASFAPDAIGGCYRIQLRVWPQANRQGKVDTDIRCIILTGANGLWAPPPEVWPQPLPDPRTGLPNSKPNEMNFGGQDAGWAGNGNDGGVRHAIRSIGAGGGGGPGYATMYVHQSSGIDPGEQDGSAAKPFASFMAAHDALPDSGGVIYVINATGTPATGDTTIAFSKPLSVIADAPQLWGGTGHAVSSSEALYVEGMTNTTDEGGQPGQLIAASLICKRCIAAFQTNVGNLDLEDCRTAGNGVVAGSARLRDCDVRSAIQANGEIDFQDCVISANLTTADVVARFTSCRWVSGTRTLTFLGSAGVMYVDAMSNFWWKAATETLTNGTKTIQGDLTA